MKNSILILVLLVFCACDLIGKKSQPSSDDEVQTTQEIPVPDIPPPSETPEPETIPKILFFSDPTTTDNNVVRRPSPNVLSVGENNFQELSEGVFDVTITQDGNQIRSEILAGYDGVVFFTAGNPPNVDVNALIEWVRGGGSFTGIHSTANTYWSLYPTWAEMLGARFKARPWRNLALQIEVRVIVEDTTHPATSHLGNSFLITDDIYTFAEFDPMNVRTLLSLDRNSLPSPSNEVYLPVAWSKSFGTGHVFYTALGDWEGTWQDPRYRQHLIKGIRWTMGLEGPR